MGFFSGLETTMLKANKALGKIPSFSPGPGMKAAGNRAKSIGSSMLGDFTKPGNKFSFYNKASLNMTVGGLAGGAAGYASSDGKTGSTMKGFGLGVLGGAAWTAGSNKMLQTGVKDAFRATKTGLKNAPGRAESWVKSMAEKERNAGAQMGFDFNPK